MKPVHGKALLALMVPFFLVSNYLANDQLPIVSTGLHFLSRFLPQTLWVCIFLFGSVYTLLSAYVSMEIDRSGKVKSSVTSGPGALTMQAWFGSKQVAKDASDYEKLFSEKHGTGDVTARKQNYMQMINHYYNLATDFYEYGWGKSFHFGRRFTGEDFHASIARHEHWLAYRAGFQPGQTILDIGCGVGGPMRAIARFTGSKIIGINNNAYQISRGTQQNVQAKLDKLCSFQQSDFMNLPFKDGEVDGAYAIEATCHAPDKVACFREIARTLKKGGVFVGYEWCMTDKYDAKNKEHQLIKHNIEIGDALPDICHTSEVDKALEAAGFKVVESEDVGVVSGQNDVPWYATLANPGFGLKNFKHSRVGIWTTHQICRTLEFLRIAPAGTTKTHEILCKAPGALVAGGVTGIFTPMYYFKAVKL